MKKRLVLLGLIIPLALVLAGCPNAANARRTLGECTVRHCSMDGKCVEYETSGRPLSEDGSDGWYFVNKATGKTVIVSGGSTTMTEH